MNKCPNCKKPVGSHRATRKSLYLRRFCTTLCADQYRRKLANNKNKYLCVICDKPNPKSKTRGKPRKTCGPKCASEYKKLYHALYDTMRQKARNE